MTDIDRHDVIEVYFDGKLQRRLQMHGPYDQSEVDRYVQQFDNKAAYEVYVNGQLYDISDNDILF